MPRPAVPESGADTPLDEAIAAYLTACAVEGKTARTLQAYAETLARLRAIASRERLPAEVAAFRATHVYTFLKAIADSGVSLGTRHRRFRETRAFFSWCTRMGYTARNPFTGIPNVKVEQKIIQPLTDGFRNGPGIQLFAPRRRTDASVAPFFVEVAQDGFEWLDKQLAGRDTIVPGRFSLADVALYAIAEFGVGVGQPIDSELKNVSNWFDAVKGRDSAQA